MKTKRKEKKRKAVQRPLGETLASLKNEGTKSKEEKIQKEVDTDVPALVET